MSKFPATTLSQGTGEEYIPMRDYLLRHNKSIFWVIEVRIGENILTEYFWLKIRFVAVNDSFWKPSSLLAIVGMDAPTQTSFYEIHHDPSHKSHDVHQTSLSGHCSANQQVSPSQMLFTV